MKRSKTIIFSRIAKTAALSMALGSTSLVYAVPITFGTFLQFSFTDAGIPATGCDPADSAGGFCIPSSGTPTTLLGASPWTFTAPADGITATITDAFEAGDQFELFDFGASLGLTSVPVGMDDCGDDPVPCLADPNISKGSFFLTAGAHSLTIVPTLAPSGGGSGYLRVVPEPGSLMLLVAGITGLLYRRKNKLSQRMRVESPA